MNRLSACFLAELRNQAVLVLRQFLPPSVVCNFEQALESTRSCLLSGLLSRDARFVTGVLPYPLESIYLQPELWQAAQDIFNGQHVCLTPAAVAQRALDDAQTASLVGSQMDMLRILLSALSYIASGGKRDSRRWAGLRKDW